MKLPLLSGREIVRALGRFPVVYVEPCESKGWRAIAKRTFDVAVPIGTEPLIRGKDSTLDRRAASAREAGPGGRVMIRGSPGASAISSVRRSPVRGSTLWLSFAGRSSPRSSRRSRTTSRRPRSRSTSTTSAAWCGG